jgi:hypothetical protein
MSGKQYVFADATHGTYDKRLEFGRVLQQPTPVTSDAAATLAEVRGEISHTPQTTSVALIAPSKKADDLSALQKKMTVTLKKRKDHGPNPNAAENRTKKGKVLAEAKETPSTVPTAPEAASAALRGLLGNYGSSSDSD